MNADSDRQKQRRSNYAAWKTEYAAYMSSPEWRGIRDLVFRRDGYVCQACLEAPATQVHHTTYRYPLSQTPLWTLYSVCTPCHEQITRMERELRGETWLNGGDK